MSPRRNLYRSFAVQGSPRFTRLARDKPFSAIKPYGWNEGYKERVIERPVGVVVGPIEVGRAPLVESLISDRSPSRIDP
jgi:hypothetical protein